MEFNYPKPCYNYGFSNYQIGEVFDSFVENLPPGTYKARDLKRSFDEYLHSMAEVPELSSKAFGSALKRKGLIPKKTNTLRCYIKE